jgi:hypothetical protein
MAIDEKDRLGDKLRDKQKGEEDHYFAARDREALERLRRQRAAAAAAAGPERGRCPRCGEVLAEADQSGVLVDQCPAGHGLWLDQGELEILAGRERDSWLGRLFYRPKR